MFQTVLDLPPASRGLHDITRAVSEAVASSGVRTGLCHVFLLHTSASLLIQENADPAVLADLETWLSGAVHDGERRFSHVLEGPDDMSAHVRTALTHTDLTLPVRDGRLLLGTWQGLYLYEHRTRSHRRRLSVTVLG
jgi:secondary thiamine-phosphate synthase enzyme